MSQTCDPTPWSRTPGDEGAHPLDHPIWAALGSRHRPIALGGGLAYRYPGAIAPFAALAGNDAASFAALGQLVDPEETVVMVTAEPRIPPAAFQVLLSRPLEQMLGVALPDPGPGPEPAPLGAPDAADMVALVELTKPGPFAPRTHELGQYLGVRVDGQLVAMAGERLCLDGFTEISAVCTHPDHRGLGHARRLIVALVRGITARGELPFLHVVSENAAAIALYRQLGFQWRRSMALNVLRKSR